MRARRLPDGRTRGPPQPRSAPGLGHDLSRPVLTEIRAQPQAKAHDRRMPNATRPALIDHALFDPALIARHDISGPRYTSYPTAPQFHAGFGETQLRDYARVSNDDPIPQPLSLYVHVPFCMSPCFYCGCTRIITRERGKAGVYLDHLYREIEFVAPLFDRDRPLVQLHFGGGTPNFLDVAQMGELLDSLARHFSFSRNAEREFGIELDPRWCDADYVRALAPLGFNRVSVGIQDFDPAVQAAVNRIQSVAQTRAVLDAARASGFRSTSVDLIYGLPRQTLKNFSNTLDQVIDLAPDRIATYAYAHLPERFKAQRQIVARDLPDAVARLALLELTVGKLTAAGYRYIGMDHFALPGDDLARAGRRQPAAQLPGLFDPRRLRPDRPRHECDLAYRLELLAERTRLARLLRRARRGPPARRARPRTR